MCFLAIDMSAVDCVFTLYSAVNLPHIRDRQGAGAVD